MMLIIVDPDPNDRYHRRPPGGRAGERKGDPEMIRFRSPLASLALSVLMTLLSIATALADSHPPIPK